MPERSAFILCAKICASLLQSGSLFGYNRPRARNSNEGYGKSTEGHGAAFVSGDTASHSIGLGNRVGLTSAERSSATVSGKVSAVAKSRNSLGERI